MRMLLLQQCNARLLPPKVVLYIAEKFCIDIE